MAVAQELNSCQDQENRQKTLSVPGLKVLVVKYLLSFACNMKVTAGTALVTDWFGPSPDNLE